MKILRIKNDFVKEFQKAVKEGTTVKIECQGINGLLDVSIIEQRKEFDNAYVVSVNNGIVLDYQEKGFGAMGITTFKTLEGENVEQNAVASNMLLLHKKYLCKYNNSEYIISMNGSKVFLETASQFLVYYAL